MVADVLAGVAALPEWLRLGVAAGTAASVLLAAVFVVGERRSPTAPRSTGASPADARRRREIRRYLRAIGEPFREDHSLAGVDVAFYLTDRDVAVTFDARAFYRIDRTATHAVLVEHELPGTRLGDRLPFETPAAAGLSAASTDPVAAAFETLALPPSATVEEVRAAYRERVKAAHPDHGGSRPAFRRVREAYETARRAAA